MPESNIHGKETPNGFLSWGATLYDFYYVRTIPLVENLITMTSGSRIAAAVRAIGETDAAVDELAWADQEEHPREVPVVDPGELALSAELRISLGAYDEFSAVDEVRTRATAKGDNKPTEQLANDGNTKVDGCNGVSTIDLPRNSALASVLMPGKPLSSPLRITHHPGLLSHFPILTHQHCSKSVFHFTCFLRLSLCTTHTTCCLPPPPAIQVRSVTRLHGLRNHQKCINTN